ncbi:MAG: hypothetical protein EOP84_23085, partial [Verrucomicrobiaceae bacterium]
ALVLSANPALGWRDVHEILASTATQINLTDADWVINGGGFKFNHKWGGGMINLTAAVVRAKDWVNLAPEEGMTVDLTVPNVPALIPDNNQTGLTRQFTFDGPNMRVEHVEFRTDIVHGHRSDLEITLTSPSGVKSVMIPKRPRPSAAFTGDDDTNYPDWTFSSTHHWGENSEGIWTLNIKDRTSGTTGTMASASVSLYGTPSVKQRVRFTEAKAIIGEDGGTRTLTVERLGGTTGAVSVDYAFSTDSSATNAEDFTGVNGTLTFEEGQSTATIEVPILEDLEVEGRESVYVLLKNPVDATLGGTTLAEVQITDNEVNAVSISSPDPIAAETREDETPETGTFVISFQSPVLANTDVFLKYSGSAVKVADYKSLPEKVTIPAGQISTTITLEPVDDTIIEGGETVVVQLDPKREYRIGDQNQAQVIIFDNEKTDIAIVASTTSVVESSETPITFTVSRRSPSDTPLIVPLITGGTAVRGTDYEENIPSAIEIAANETSYQFSVTPINDEIYRKPRVLTVLLGKSETDDYTE